MSTTLYSAMYGVISQASLTNLETWRNAVKAEIDHPTNKSIGWDNREHKLSARLETLEAIIAKRYDNRNGARITIGNDTWIQMGLPE